MKKLLALVLALVMTLSLCTISNAAYSDAADVDYKEAVDVMTAVGVFQGADGKFSPKAELTREQAAKLIAYLDLGEKVAEALPAVKAFNDVEANRWSAKYVAYCASAGYLAGVGDGNFDPAGKLTGYAFGKMLLCVLGYDADVEGFTGGSWQIAVAKLMQSLELADGVDGSASAALTREQAAQYCFNALKSTTVDYEDKGTQVTINGAVIATGASKAASVPAVKKNGKDTKNYNANLENGDGYIQLCEKLYGNDLQLTTKGTDSFGRPADTWNYKGAKDDIGTYGTKTPVVTYTAETTLGQIYNDLGKVEVKTLEFYRDGDKVGTIKDNAGTTITAASIVADAKNKVGAQGSALEIYKIATGSYRAVLVNTYVGEITDWNEAVYYTNGDVKTKENVEITSNGMVLTFNTTAFSEDDAKTSSKAGTVVICTATYNDKTGKYTVKSAKAAESAEVVVTSVKSSSFVADGTTYKFAWNYAAGNDYFSKYADVAYSSTGDNKYEVYFDAYGNVVASKAVSVDNATGYAVVTAVSSQGASWSDGKGTYQAKLVMADGTEEVVDINKETYDMWTSGNSGKKPVVVKYTINNKGLYTVAKAADADVAEAANSNFKLTKGVSKVTYGSGDYVYANGKTVFFVGTTKTVDGEEVTTWKVVTGIANMNSIEYKSGAMVAGVVDGTALKAALVVDAKSTTTASKEDIIFVAGDSTVGTTTDAAGTYYTYNAVIGGEITTINTEAQFTTNEITDSVAYTADGVAETVGNSLTGTDLVSYEGKKVTAAPKDGVVTIETNNTLSIADDCAVFVVEDGEITEGKLADAKVDTTVSVITVKNVVEYVFVLK